MYLAVPVFSYGGAAMNEHGAVSASRGCTARQGQTADDLARMIRLHRGVSYPSLGEPGSASPKRHRTNQRSSFGGALKSPGEL